MDPLAPPPARQPGRAVATRRPTSPGGLALSLLLALALVGCGGGRDLPPALTDDSTCEEVVAVVEESISQARAYLGTDADDPVRAGDLIFALSAVDERPDCVDAETADTARGLRGALNAGSS